MVYGYNEHHFGRILITELQSSVLTTTLQQAQIADADRIRHLVPTLLKVKEKESSAQARFVSGGVDYPVGSTPFEVRDYVRNGPFIGLFDRLRG